MTARVQLRGATIALACGLALLAASACDGPDLPKSWRLEYPRVLAQRSEVVGDETRATPEPGESVRVRVLIAGPEPIERLHYSLVACASDLGSGELPTCAAEPFAQLEGMLGEDEALGDELAAEIELPADDDLRDVRELLIAGVACTEGEARNPGDPRADRCAGSDEPALAWAGTLRIAHDESDYNANPELPDDAITFDQETWPTAVPADATDPELSVRADGEPHEIRVNLEDAGRERDDGDPEALLLTHFTSAGALARRFSVLESDDPDDHPLTIEWKSPRRRKGEKPPPSSAKLVFVLRDQRGGVAYTQRELAIDAE